MSIFRNPAAFAPFYRDLVAVEGSRPSGRGVAVFRSPLKACVLDMGLDDPLSDASTGTNRRRWQIRVRLCDWPEVEPPTRGDLVHIPGEFAIGGDPVKASVQSIARTDDCYVLEVRQ